MPNPLMLLLLSVLLPSAAGAQAPAMRPVPRPPVSTPGYAPGTPPEPVHAPAGAGAPHGFLTEPGKQAPRSPNKRLLPSAKEPGLWAADGAPVASTANPAPLFNVPLPYPAPEWGLGARLLMDRCIQGVHDAAEQVGKRATYDAFPPPARKCLAAIHIFVCGHDESLKLIEAAHDGASVTEDEIKAAANLQAHGRELRASLCPDAGVTPQQQAVFDAVLKRWMSNELNGRTSRSAH